MATLFSLFSLKRYLDNKSADQRISELQDQLSCSDWSELKALVCAHTNLQPSEFDKLPPRELVNYIELAATAHLTQQQPGAMLSYPDLARKHNVNKESLRKALSNWKLQHDSGFITVENPRPRQPRELFDESAVMEVIQAVKSRQQTASEKKSSHKSSA